MAGGEKGFLEGHDRESKCGVGLDGWAGHVGDVIAWGRVDQREGSKGGRVGLLTVDRMSK